MENIIKISPSSVQTLDKCPRAWFFRYIKKLYPDVEKDGAAEFGSFVHDIAENFKKCSISEYKELVKKSLAKFKLTDKYRAKVGHGY
jgi:RecB family exonuclease